MVGHLSVKDSIKGTLGGGPLLGKAKHGFFLEIWKMPCRRASLFTGALLRNLEGFVYRDF